MFMQNVLVGVLISFQWANGIPVSKGNPIAKKYFGSQQNQIAVNNNLQPKPAPVFNFPKDGEKLSLKGNISIEVEKVEGARGYLFGFFQEGKMVWENLKDENKLSETSYVIKPDTDSWKALKPGKMEVWCRAAIGREWTARAIIKVTLELAEYYRSYSEWVKDEKKETYSCDYKYPNISGGYSTQKVVVYYADPDRKNWAYYYNTKKDPWVRCATKSNPKYNTNVMYWQKLDDDKKGYQDYPEKGYCPTPGDGKEPVTDLPLPSL